MIKKIYLFVCIFTLFGTVPVKGNSHQTHSESITNNIISQIEIQKDIKANALTKIDDNYSFKYVFPQGARKMGSSVLRVEVLYNGVRTTDLDIDVEYDMPSMKAHKGKAKMRVNKNSNVYLEPINFVMGGEWEVVLIFKKDGKIIYKGSISVKI
ncbi:MAG: FixH family protein [Rickettsiales bacterium]|nr:FixH family protein [Rickettsiales bacterium]